MPIIMMIPMLRTMVGEKEYMQCNTYMSPQHIYGPPTPPHPPSGAYYVCMPDNPADSNIMHFSHAHKTTWGC